jgi:hypothetical protein
MQQFFDSLPNPALFIDMAISLLALSFMCALTYAMRWLPGKANEYKNSTLDAAVHQHNLSTLNCDSLARYRGVASRSTTIQPKEAATIE